MLLFWIFLQLFITPCISRALEVSSVEQIIQKQFTFIYFYAPDCVYCRAFSDDFNYISQLYQSDPNFQVVQINGRTEQDLKNKFDVHVFPTLKLYDHVGKRLHTFSQERSVKNLQEFIRFHTGVEPQYGEVKSVIQVVSTEADIDRQRVLNQATIIAFVDENDIEWTNYYYPDHFYNSVATRFTNIKFLLHFSGTTGSNLMRVYHVSKIPSLVMIKDGHIAIHNTLSTNPMVNGIEASDIEVLMNDFASKKDGIWFENFESLAIYANDSKFTGHLQRKPGMNIVDGKHETALDDMDLEEQYQKLLKKVSL